jgi:hypothetical protein
LHAQLDEIWDEASTYIRARNDYHDGLEINYSSLTIRYKNTSGNWVTIDQKDLVDADQKDLIHLMEKVRRLARRVYHFCTPVELGIDSNRAYTGAKGPLPVRVREQALQQPQAGRSFLVSEQYKTLYQALQKEGFKHRELGEQIKMTDAFIDTLTDKVREEKERAERELAGNRAHLSHVQIEKANAHIRKLSEKLHELEGLNRYAVYWNVGVCGTLQQDPAAETSAVRLERTEFLRKHMYDDLVGRVSPKSWFGKRDSSSVAQPVLDYTLGAMHLHNHERAALQETVKALREKSEEAGEPEQQLGSMEEFVVHQMKHLLTPNFDEEGALSSLNLSTDSQDVTRIAMRNLTQGARQETAKNAEAIKKDLLRATAGTPKAPKPQALKSPEKPDLLLRGIQRS